MGTPPDLREASRMPGALSENVSALDLTRIAPFTLFSGSRFRGDCIQVVKGPQEQLAV